MNTGATGVMAPVRSDRRRGRYLPAAAIALLCGFAFADVAIPPVARVTDLSGTLSASERETLTQRLAEFEARKGSQIALLIVPTTQPQPIRGYALRVAEAWKLGRSGVDDGVLVVVAVEDREIAIEVGYGLEGAIPDAVARRVIDEIVVPRLRNGDVAGALHAGVQRIIRLVDGEPLPPRVASGTTEPDRRRWSELLTIGLMALLVFSLGIGALTLMLSKAVGRWPAIALVTGLGALAAYWLDPDWIPLLAATAASAAVGLFATSARIGVFHGGAHTTTYHDRGVGSRGGGGGSGGGFSGGGGSFGGGGAAGRW